jgi:hypothetical protein
MLKPKKLNIMTTTTRIGKTGPPMRLIFEIHPLMADYDKRKAGHPVTLALAVFRGMAGNKPVGDTPANWPEKERQESGAGLPRQVGKLASQLTPREQTRESLVLSVNATLKIPVEHWRPENRAAEIKKVADALAQIGEVDGLSVKPGMSYGAPPHPDACQVCGWVHDPGFTQIKTNHDETIVLGGRLPEIVALVHHAHERGLAGLSTKDEALHKVCAGYRHPCKAFADLNHRRDYQTLFDTRKRGFLSLRGANGINRNKSQSNPE